MTAAPEPIGEWTDELSRLARRDGWDVWSRADGPRYEIQRVDDHPGPLAFETDHAAFSHVEALARAYGSSYYAVALRIHDFYEAEHEAALRKREFEGALWRSLSAGQRAKRPARPRGEAEIMEASVA